MGKRFKTKYPGIYYIEGSSSAGKVERIYYIKYNRSGKTIEEPVGRQFRDAMTPAKAALIRTRRIEGEDTSNKEKRNAALASVKNINVIYDEYVDFKNHKPSTRQPEKAKYLKYIHPEHGSIAF